MYVQQRFVLSSDRAQRLCLDTDCGANWLAIVRTDRTEDEEIVVGPGSYVT